MKDGLSVNQEILLAEVIYSKVFAVTRWLRESNQTLRNDTTKLLDVVRSDGRK
jgi:hypothetical protein